MIFTQSVATTTYGYFDSNSGRFIGQDPIGFGGGDANLYRYVGNNSANLTDPSGLRPLLQSERIILAELRNLAQKIKNVPFHDRSPRSLSTRSHTALFGPNNRFWDNLWSISF